MKSSRLFIFLSLFFLSATLLQAQGNKSITERLGFPSDAKLLIIHADDLERNYRNPES